MTASPSSTKGFVTTGLLPSTAIGGWKNGLDGEKFVGVVKGVDARWRKGLLDERSGFTAVFNGGSGTREMSLGRR